MNVLTKIKNAVYSNPTLTRFRCAAALSIAGSVNGMAARADFDPSDAIEVMVGWVVAILVGAGVIYLLVAAFNWAAAAKQEDSERQSKAITNVFIAGGMIAIGSLAAALITAFGGDNTYGLE